MPYILPHLRPALDPTGDASKGAEVGNSAPLQLASNAGELNFQISKLVAQFIKDRGGNYDAMNSAVGALECCKLEVYRRIVAPYESTKIATNGDVFT